MNSVTTKLPFVAALAIVIAGAAPASGQTTAPARTSRFAQTLVLLAGGAAGLGIHESGHVVTSAIFGADPRIRGLESGPIPFFAIRHDPVTRRQEFVISSAGFWMQHAGSEWLLTARPNVRHERATFVKGIFAFNLATSVVYSVAAFTGSGPLERDTRGMAISLGHDGVPEPAIGALILAPAVLDGYRYLKPDAAWAKWASRVVKIVGVVLTFVPD